MDTSNVIREIEKLIKQGDELLLSKETVLGMPIFGNITTGETVYTPSTENVDWKEYKRWYSKLSLFLNNKIDLPKEYRISFETYMDDTDVNTVLLLIELLSDVKEHIECGNILPKERLVEGITYQRSPIASSLKTDHLLGLIQRTDDIEKFFHNSEGVSGIPSCKIIYDVPEFCEWIKALQFALQKIFDCDHDHFIWDILVTIKQGFNGWNDKKSFNSLRGSLKAIERNIANYYSYDSPATEKYEEELKVIDKEPKIFISHSSKDVKYASDLVQLFTSIGLSESDIFCSSVVGFGIPINEDIYDYLRSQFDRHSLHVFFMLSGNYYDSEACLNEMGAAWVLKNKYTSILLPHFDFKDIKGAVNPRQIGLKLDGNIDDVKLRLGQIKDNLSDAFELSKISDVRWEKMRDSFIDAIKANSTTDLRLETAQIYDGDGAKQKYKEISNLLPVVFPYIWGPNDLPEWVERMERLIIKDIYYKEGEMGSEWDGCIKSVQYIYKDGVKWFERGWRIKK